MKYSDLVDVYKDLESTPSKLEKAKIVSELIKRLDDDDVEEALALISGDIFPRHSQKEMGISTKLISRTISLVTGHSADDIEDMFREEGDLGVIIEKTIEKKKQTSLFSVSLTTGKILKNLRSLASIEGAKSQKKKIDIVVELLNSCNPVDGKYLIRTVLGELRIGVADGIIKDSIVLAYLEKDKETSEAVNYAHNILNDFGKVAVIARNGGVKGLKSVKIEIGKPHSSMLGEATDSISDVISKFPCAIEPKLDGMRAQIHKRGTEVMVFTRSLENITKQFPDVVKYCKKGLNPDKCVVEAEIVALDSDGNHLPFQKLSKRIQRKHKIDDMVEEIPVQVNIFDMTLLNSKMLLDEAFKSRREALEKNVISSKNLALIDQLVTEDEKKAEKYYQKVLAAGDEGVMVKNLEAPYIFGRKVNGWYKVKPVLEPLDLVILGATWGEGKRSNWLSSFALGVRDPDTGEFLECGRMSTGLTEEQYDEITKRIKSLIVSEKGRIVVVKPKIVVEVGYQEIQQSPTYSSKYALRFPRMLRLREDKDVEDADDIKRLEKIYKQQFKK